MPSFFPPVLPSTAPPPDSLLSSYVGASPAVLLATFPSSSGLHFAAECTDPAFAPSAACATAASSAQVARSGLVCPWGAGGACVPCPPGALCPGGTLLVATAGHWLPPGYTTPADVVACGDPEAAARCPGGPEGTCGEGYAGFACSTCGAGFFFDAGVCSRCPSIKDSAVLIVGVLYFVAALLALGAATLALAVLALRKGRARSGAAQKPLRATIWEASAMVGALLLWLWNSAQGVASLFSQAQVLAPPALRGVYVAATALKFQGISVSPACFSAVPFGDFWGALAAVAGLLTALAAALLALAAQGRRPGARCEAAARGTVGLAVLALTIGFGPLTTQIAGVLTCTPPQPMTVRDYLAAGGDGATLQGAPYTPTAAFPSVPPLAALLAAAASPVYASSSGLAPYLRTPVRASLLNSGAIQVCREGAHAPVYAAAQALGALFCFGFPLLTLAVLRRRYLRDRVSGGGGGGALTAARAARPFAVLAAAFADPRLAPHAYWLPPLQQFLVVVFSACVAVSLRTSEVPTFIASQAIAAAFALLGAAAVQCRRASLYAPQHEWLGRVGAMLYLLVALTAALNATVRVKGVAWAAQEGRGTALATIPLVAAAALLVVLLVSWWGALLAHATRALVEKRPQRQLPLEGDGLLMVANPLFAVVAPPGGGAPRRAPRPPRTANPVWTLVMDADGDTFWYNKATKESQWKLPKGADTASGWVYVPRKRRGGGGYWRHAGTGEITTHRKLICQRTPVERFPGAPEARGVAASTAAALGVERVVFLPRASQPGSAAPEDVKKEAWYSPSMKASDLVNELLRARNLRG
jgi:hypothetical protein